MVSLSSLQIRLYQEPALPGDKKTQPEEQPSRERFWSNNLTFAGRLFGLSLGRKVTPLP